MSNFLIFWCFSNEFCIKSPKCFNSLSDTEHGWAHGSNRVYTYIHGLTGTSIELQLAWG